MRRQGEFVDHSAADVDGELLEPGEAGSPELAAAGFLASYAGASRSAYAADLADFPSSL